MESGILAALQQALQSSVGNPLQTLGNAAGGILNNARTAAFGGTAPGSVGGGSMMATLPQMLRASSGRQPASMPRQIPTPPSRSYGGGSSFGFNPATAGFATMLNGVGSFGNQMQNAMGQMWEVNQANAQNGLARDNAEANFLLQRQALANQYGLGQQALGVRNRGIDALAAAFSGVNRQQAPNFRMPNIGALLGAGEKAWGNPLALAARQRLQAPGQSPMGAGQNTQYQDLLRSSGAANLSALDRAGTQADAGLTLDSQTQGAAIGNAQRRLQASRYAAQQQLNNQNRGDYLGALMRVLG